jgi:hypothetical protein
VNARERTQLVVRPDPSRDGVHLVDDTVYLVFFRALLAFDANTGALRWAHLHPTDIVGAEVVHGAVVLVDAGGSVVWLGSHAGNVLDHHELGIQAAQAAFQLPIESPLPQGHAEPEGTAEAGLAAVASVDDARMIPVRVLAVRALANVPGAESTRALVAVASVPNAPDELRDAAGDALSQRTDGTRAMLDALDVHADFFRRTHAPPVGFIARALAHAHERRAVPQLVAHLQDPATPATDLAAIATALGDLGDPAAIAPLTEFVVTYHADQGTAAPVGGGAAVDDETAADRDALRTAVGAAAGALVALGGAPERRRLDALAHESATVPEVRHNIEHALAPPSPPPQPIHVASASPPPSGPPAVDRSRLPPRLTTEMIAHAFAPVRRELLGCLPHTAAPPAVRIEFRYDGDGHVLNTIVRPDGMSACMSPIVARVQFPATQVFREVRMFMLAPDHGAAQRHTPAANPRDTLRLDRP